MIDDAVGELAGFVLRNTAGFAAELVVDHIFSRHTARFFHGVGRRVIVAMTCGGIRIPSSLRMVPHGTKAKPRGSDWLALGTGVGFWIALFLALGYGASHLL